MQRQFTLDCRPGVGQFAPLPLFQHVGSAACDNVRVGTTQNVQENKLER